MISASTYDPSFAPVPMATNLAPQESATRINTQQSGTQAGGSRSPGAESLHLSIKSEVSYANHLARIYPATKIPTGHTAAEGDSMHEYLSGLNFSTNRRN